MSELHMCVSDIRDFVESHNSFQILEEYLLKSLSSLLCNGYRRDALNFICISGSQLGRDFACQGTVGSVQRHFWLSQLQKGCYRHLLSRVNNISPPEKNYLAQG